MDRSTCEVISTWTDRDQLMQLRVN